MHQTSFDYAKYLFTKEVLIGSRQSEGVIVELFKHKTYAEFNKYLYDNRIEQNTVSDYIYTIIQRPTRFHEIYNDLAMHSMEKLNIFNSIVFKIFSIESDKEDKLDEDMNDVICGLTNM
jgi:hypothetical protein